LWIDIRVVYVWLIKRCVALVLVCGHSWIWIFCLLRIQVNNILWQFKDSIASVLISIFESFVPHELLYLRIKQYSILLYGFLIIWFHQFGSTSSTRLCHDFLACNFDHKCLKIILMYAHNYLGSFIFICERIWFRCTIYDWKHTINDSITISFPTFASWVAKLELAFS
jgi:hypothetical protein